MKGFVKYKGVQLYPGFEKSSIVIVTNLSLYCSVTSVNHESIFGTNRQLSGVFLVENEKRSMSFYLNLIT